MGAEAAGTHRAVRLLATGGTIASTVVAGGGRRATVSGARLLGRTAVPPGVHVTVADRATVGSFAWQAADLLDLLAGIGEALDAGADGVVVTHGTDTMEEVAFLAELVHDDPRPVVFTGAQRAFDDPAPDGPANLADALTVASSPHARDRGVLVCFDGSGFPARGTTKVDTLGAHAFDAPGRGAALRVAGGAVRALTPAGRPPVLPVSRRDLRLPRVDVVAMYVGTDAAPLHAAVAAGARGVLLAAFGAGNANPEVVDAVREAVGSGVPVLVCSRAPAGPVTPLYTGGGGVDLVDAGAVFGADLSPWQGRILLSAALSAPDPMTALTTWLNAPGRPG